MYTCQLCRFDTHLDDVALPRGDAACVCLACYGRATGSALRMPKDLRRQLQAALAAADRGDAAPAATADHP